MRDLINYATFIIRISDMLEDTDINSPTVVGFIHKKNNYTDAVNDSMKVFSSHYPVIPRKEHGTHCGCSQNCEVAKYIFDINSLQFDKREVHSLTTRYQPYTKYKNDFKSMFTIKGIKYMYLGFYGLITHYRKYCMMYKLFKDSYIFVTGKKSYIKRTINTPDYYTLIGKHFHSYTTRSMESDLV